MTAFARARPTPSREPSPITWRVTPQTRPDSLLSASRTSACSMTSIPGSSVTAARRAREISAPVASPPACRIRLVRWPPSRVSAISPDAARSNTAPRAMSRATASGPSVTSAWTAFRSQRPAPAFKVSASCAAGESPGPSAAAMPPCAHFVDPSSTRALVTSKTEYPYARI